MPATLVSLQNISVKYQSQIALNQISLDIIAGDHVAIIGKSGSGKSLLLKVIAGLQSVNGGQLTRHYTEGCDGTASASIVLVDSRHHFKNGSNTTDLYYQQRFNSFDSDDSLTVKSYLAGIAKDTRPGYWSIENVVERLNLTALYNKELIKLSNGETKRLRLASALIKNPKLLLLDQPLTGLDVDARKSFDALLHEIAEAGTTIVMATSPNEIPSVINKVVLLTSGRTDLITYAADYRIKQLSRHSNDTNINTEHLAGLLSADYERFDTIIKMANVNVQYGEKNILKNIDWEVRQGDRWALLGHNGAGKSTLLTLVYGDNPQAYANDIVLFDKQRGTGESIWDIKKKCGFVSPELFQYFPTDNSCLQVIESGFYDTLGLFRMSEPSRAALSLKWMEVLGIGQYARQLLKNIPASAQRLCFLARALVRNPILLILDEPCQGMDEDQKENFKHIIDTICEQSDMTMIYVTHYTEELPDAVNKFIKLSAGEVVEQSA
ncbi:ATP-binding cassette domain-containing protein [Mucilaginibacter ginkgonis]|uniref:ATP-binding cassette domain-containing protein n=1 Tax=Mucilaginibacter ginkgonis TaxID=2682091 RepID=A0A6I4INT1_9SPHI|nr:ATP-binding cassette domain-containing protein [Mucilaginibacter ginkgonis]QQL48381.1 ATP-binding cassette domain-containing protein [Mucilaginibacter ginkgonis]